MPRHNLYFIAIIPPDDISREVTDFKNDFKENYNSSAALKNMPHITLKAPFTIDVARHDDVVKWFESLPVTKASFPVELQNFGAFPNPENPVVFVHPVMTVPLKTLQSQIVTSFISAFPSIPVHYFEHQFKPHMTIAYRDLEFSEFDRAWKEVYCSKEYSARFEVNGFHLLQHNSREWNVIAEHRVNV